jgi:GWxTD domain-containing protein
MRFLVLPLLAYSLVYAQKLPEKYSVWLEEEVPYLITKEERRDFLALKTDAERDRFMQEFWEVRNPARGSNQNPVKDEHYKRIDYANRHFGRMSGTPGWRTDMGRTYILFGPPQSRSSYIGYGQMYPMELWFFANRTGAPSLPPFFHVLFFMPDDIGEFRYYRPIGDGPMKLVRGAQFRGNGDVYRFLKPVNPELARAAFSLIPSEPFDAQEFRPSVGSEMLVGKIQSFADDAFNVERLQEARSLRERVKSWFLVNQQRPIDAAHFVWTDGAGQLWLDYAFRVDSAQLGRSVNGQFLLDSGFRLLTPEGALIVEDSEERAYPMGQSFEPFLIANRVPLSPGKYKLEIQVANREAARSWRAEQVIDAETPNAVAVRGPLLAASAARAAQADAAAPFQYFGAQFTPAVNRAYSKRDSVVALFYLQTAGNYRLEYVLASPQNRESRQFVADEVAETAFRNGALLKSKTISLTELEPGDYRLIVNVRSPDSPAVLASASVPFKIGDPLPAPPLYFAAGTKAVMAPGVASYIRGLQELARNQDDRAAGYLSESMTANPANASALHALVRIYFRTAKYDQITELYKRAGETAFRASSETLAQTALSFWRTGDKEQAHRILKAGGSYFPKDASLQAAARAIESETARVQ